MCVLGEIAALMSMIRGCCTGIPNGRFAVDPDGLLLFASSKGSSAEVCVATGFFKVLWVVSELEPLAVSSTVITASMVLAACRGSCRGSGAHPVILANMQEIVPWWTEGRRSSRCSGTVSNVTRSAPLMHSCLSTFMQRELCCI